MPDRVVVAMSGGVDSSLAAALLVEQGYEVIGVMLRLWAEPQPPALPGEAIEAANRCCSGEAVDDARAVAGRLGIPFYVVDARARFHDTVVAPFVEGYAAGLTPNPCLVCNREIRFGYLMRYALGLGAHFLATGHYARIQPADGNSLQLRRGLDRRKDQSYVLSVLGQDDLRRVRFPVGDCTKDQVRAFAAARGLPTASRGESQDLCFVADGDYRRFLAGRIPEAIVPGPILDGGGRRLGTHRGLPFYTIGQRGGLGIAAPRPFYVLELDPARNALVVGHREELGRSEFLTREPNWIAGAPPGRIFACEVQIRYRASPLAATVTVLTEGGVHVRLAQPVRDIAPGQAAVFYDGDICLGGGVILGAG